MRDLKARILINTAFKTRPQIYSPLIQWAKPEIIDLEVMLEAIAVKNSLNNSKPKLNAQSQSVGKYKIKRNSDFRTGNKDS